MAELLLLVLCDAEFVMLSLCLVPSSNKGESTVHWEWEVGSIDKPGHIDLMINMVFTNVTYSLLEVYIDIPYPCP